MKTIVSLKYFVSYCRSLKLRTNASLKIHKNTQTNMYETQIKPNEDVFSSKVP